MIHAVVIPDMSRWLGRAPGQKRIGAHKGSNYDPNQPRDDQGQWTDGPGGGEDPAYPHSAEEYPSRATEDEATLGGLPTQQASALKNIEPSLRPRAEERMVAYDTNGIPVIDKSGSKTQVVFTPDEIDKMKAATGLVYTHNHPGGRSISPEDLSLGVAVNAEEVRAVGRDRGRDVTYRASHGKGKEWPDSGVILQVWSTEDGLQLIKFRRQIDEGTLDIATANFEHGHEVMTRVAKRLGLRYKRVIHA